ncbi:MAG: ATP-binding cassette domain-containing protein [Anaerolineales bacterium]|jgi:ABC-2 type transport system ATP-binding protein
MAVNTRCISNREIRVVDLAKYYPGDVKAVDGISFEVSAGQIFGFLGPNGAGKSTAIKILTTLALPSSGYAEVGGYDVVEQAGLVRCIAGVALQEIGLDPIMTSREMLSMQAQLFGASTREARKRADELLELVRLTDALERRVGTYSGGMRRRLDLALALVHEPEILFLDEPTTGLDPASRRDVWTEVRRLNKELGMTIFLTTQYLEEADELADQIAIIDQGRIRTQGSPAKLKASVGSEAINLAFEDQSAAQRAHELFGDLNGNNQVDRDTLRLYMSNAAEAIPEVLRRLEPIDLTPISITLTQPTLDDVFLQVTGQSFQAEENETVIE